MIQKGRNSSEAQLSPDRELVIVDGSYRSQGWGGGLEVTKWSSAPSGSPGMESRVKLLARLKSQACCRYGVSELSPWKGPLHHGPCPC